MSRRQRFNAVATTALVAAFPVFSLFADETPTQNDAAPQTIAPEVAPYDETLAPPDVNSAFADFNVSLFEIPNGESVEFYRKRVDEIEREWNRLAFPYATQQREFARKSNPKQAFNQASLITNAPIGTVYDGKRFVAAPADSIPGRRAVALADLYGRLADAPELPLEVRGQYYRNWLAALDGPLGERSIKERRDFYARLLDDEKAKSPLDLGRVFCLNGVISHYEFHIKDDAESQTTVDQADLEKLLDIPEGENAEFYQKRRAELDRAYLQRTLAERRNGVAPDQNLSSRVKKAVAELDKRRSEALKAEADAFDRDAVKQLFDVPSRESAAFYLERYKKTRDVWKQVSKLAQYQEGRDLGTLELRLRTETLPEIAKRLAYADELEPLERFEYFQNWLRFCDVEELRAALDAEIARDATSEVDACRELYVKRTLAEKLLADALAETRKALPEAERRTTFKVSPNPTVEPEAQALFDEAFNAIAELANGGAIPWFLGLSWAEWAENLALSLQNDDYHELATQLRKDVRDALAGSENETERRVLRKLERHIRANEILGSEIPVDGQNLDGTPFDWASYRGEPVLIVSGAVQADWTPNYDDQFLQKCVEAGLKVVRYYTDLEDAKKSAKYLQDEFDAIQKMRAQGFKPNLGADRSTLASAYLVASAPLSWPYEHGIVWVEFGVLFDADGRVLAVDRTPLESERSPEIADELRRLFPDVPVVERK